MLASLYLVAFVLPLLAALAAIVLGPVQHESKIVHGLLMLSGITGLSATFVFFNGLMHGTVTAVTVFSALLLPFAVTPLSAFFLGIVFLGVLLTSWYAMGYLPHYRETYSLAWLDAASGVFIFGMLATLMAGQPFAFLLAWEVMSVSAYFLIIADGSPESLSAGLRYILMAQLGFLCLLAGFMLLAGGSALVSWAAVASAASALPHTVQAIAFFLLLAGFGSKAGLVPLHQWLPFAHPQAPSHSSALLSGVMLKVALYGFILSTSLFVTIPLSWSLVVIVVGLVSAFFGVLHAVVENDAKRMLAWSSIENMGLLFAGTGFVLALPHLSTDPAITALAAVLAGFVALHALNHSLFKSGLFMATGAVVLKTHTRELDRLGGLAGKWPLFSGVFLVLALSAAALPPTGTFFGEWLLLQSLAAGFASTTPLVALGFALALASVALVGGLAIFAFMKLFSVAFLGRARTVSAEDVPAMPRALTYPPLVSAVLVGTSGLFAFPFLANLGTAPLSGLLSTRTVTSGASMNPWLVIGVLVCTVVVVFVARRVLSVRREIRVTGTWDCGTPLTPRMQYTATGFSAPIRFFFRSFVLARKELVVLPVVATNPWIAERKLTWGTDSFWEVWLYRPVAQAALSLSYGVRRIQNGAVQFYLLLVLIALVSVILFAL